MKASLEAGIHMYIVHSKAKAIDLFTLHLMPTHDLMVSAVRIRASLPQKHQPAQLQDQGSLQPAGGQGSSCHTVLPPVHSVVYGSYALR